MSLRERGRKNLTRPSGTEFGAFGVAVADDPFAMVFLP
jgi:hypothetical protein